jgi:hypothetical protein
MVDIAVVLVNHLHAIMINLKAENAPNLDSSPLERDKIATNAREQTEHRDSFERLLRKSR